MINFVSTSLIITFCNHTSIQLNLFTVDQNDGENLTCILTKFKLSTPCRFQDIAFKVNDFPLTSELPFFQYCMAED